MQTFLNVLFALAGIAWVGVLVKLAMAAM